MKTEGGDEVMTRCKQKPAGRDLAELSANKEMIKGRFQVPAGSA